MAYNIKFYNKTIADKREQFCIKHQSFSRDHIDTNKLFFNYILLAIKNISQKRKGKIKILDLGTGNGYVPRNLVKLSKANLNIIGVDLSEEMISMAKIKTKNSRVKYMLADNRQLPFNNKTFDIVTNKLSTQFDLPEVKRVLKSDGCFIFKEYGRYKGFKEIYNIFPKRYKKSPKNLSDYIILLQGLNFYEIISHSFLFNRQYRLTEIKDIFEMTNLINNFNLKDLNYIKNKIFEGKRQVTIHSDPFIIFAKNK